MSIIIKGMDMPISCEKCPLCYDYLHCSVDESLDMYAYNRHPDCPLIEINDIHYEAFSIFSTTLMKKIEESILEAEE